MFGIFGSLGFSAASIVAKKAGPMAGPSLFFSSRAVLVVEARSVSSRAVLLAAGPFC
jgi:hypothetical protein